MTVHEQIEQLCLQTKSAVDSIATAGTKKKNEILQAIARMLIARTEDILEANSLDVEAAREAGLSEAMIDRLSLNQSRIEGICRAIDELIGLPDPIGTGECWTRPSGLEIKRVRVPLGVVGIIYEARPNVTVDAATMCIKSGNAVILRGGKEAIRTNVALVNAMKEALAECLVNPDVVSLVENTDRESATELMGMRDYIDVLIPRGGKGLIRSVIENAKVPVIETGAGNCHLFVDDSADMDMAVDVAINAKCSRPSVCNAVETMLVHAGIAAEFLPRFAEAAKAYDLQIRGCAKTNILLPDSIEATEEDYDTEFHDYILAVKVVPDINDAINHIHKYSTGHSEAILTRSLTNAERFQREIHSAAVYVNASTRFTDGGEFGFGAEIGISTQKLHARGPMGLTALTTEQYRITGDGTVR